MKVWIATTEAMVSIITPPCKGDVPGPNSAMETGLPSSDPADQAIRTARDYLAASTSSGEVLSKYVRSGLRSHDDGPRHGVMAKFRPVHGHSVGLGAAACYFVTVLSRFASSLGLVAAPQRPLFCTGTLDQAGAVQQVAGLTKKIEALKRDLEALGPGGGLPLFLVPDTQADVARTGLIGAGLADAVDVRGIANLDDALAAALESFTDPATDALWGVPAPPTLAGPEPRWSAMPRRLSLHASVLPDSFEQFILGPYRVVSGKAQANLAEFLALGWSWWAAPADAPGRDRARNPGAWFCQRAFEAAAWAYASRAIAENARLLGPAPAAVQPGQQDDDLLSSWRGGHCLQWSNEKWMELGRGALDCEPKDVEPALARIALLTEGIDRASDPMAELAAELSVINLFGPTPSVELGPLREIADRDDPEPPGQPLLAWDVDSFARTDSSSSLSSPVVGVWVHWRDADLEQVVVVGRGHGRIRREVDGLLNSTALRLPPGARDIITAGLRVFGVAGEDPALADLPAWLAVGVHGLDPQGDAGTVRAQLLTALVDDLRELAQRSGMVAVHDVRGVQEAVDLAIRTDTPGLSQVLAPAHGLAVTHLRARHSGAALAIPTPGPVFRTAAFNGLVAAWGGVVLDGIRRQLRNRVEFYSGHERRLLKQSEEWQARPDDEKAREPPVWADTEVDWEKMIVRKGLPRPVEASVFYGDHVPEQTKQVRGFRLRFEQYLMDVEAAQLASLPELAARLFADAAIRCLAIDDVVAGADAELRTAYEAWRAEAAPLLHDSIDRWCAEHNLDDPASRRQLFVRHVAWRLMAGRGTLLVPHVVVDSTESRVAFDAGRGLRWAVHPLDAAYRRLHDDVRARAQVDEEVTAVRSAAEAGRLTEAVLDLRDIWATAPVVTLETLLEQVRSASRAEPWSVTDREAAAREATRRMAPIRAVFRAHSPWTHGTYEELSSCVLQPPPGGVVPLPGAMALKERFEPWEKLPELPMMLAHLRAHYGVVAGEEALEGLARAWDPEYLGPSGKAEVEDWRRGRWSQSKAFRDGLRLRHLEPQQRAAWSIERARSLYSMALQMAEALSRVDWRGASLRVLYLELGALADAIAETHLMDLSMPTELLEAAGIATRQEDAP